jgi:ABC-type transporter Mla subunit MlaD
MAQSKMEWKVGLFVFIGLVLLAVLMLNFSKGMSLFKKTYELRLKAEDVGGIKPKAGVLMSGVKIGNVLDSELKPDGAVIIRLRISEDYKIDRDSRFFIDSLGFLGDQYIAIEVTNRSGQFLANGDEVVCEPPLNLQAAMRSTAGLLLQAQTTMKTLDTAISNVNRSLLNNATLASFSQSISNIQTISANANQTLGKIDRLVQRNGPTLSSSVSNLHDFSAELKVMMATNQTEITEAIKNLRGASVTLNELLADVKATNGTAGLLLRDEQMKAEIGQLVTNLNSVAENFSTFGSNLNSRGIWSMLWKPKPPKKSERER